MEGKKEHKIEIRSEEVQDILGQVPSWIVRWGTMVIVATVLIILAGSTIFRYPDIKRADILVTTENPPANLKARTDGQIEEFFVDDSQFVKINTPLAEIENPADYSDVLSLRFDMEQIRTMIANLMEGEYIPLSNTYKLGEIQSAYAEFSNAYEDYFLFLQRDSYAKRISSIQEEINQFEVMNNNLRRQLGILLQEYQLAQRQFRRDSILHVQGVIPDAEIDQSKQGKLAAQLKYEESRANIATNRIEITNLEQERQELELRAQQEREQKEIGVRDAIGKLIAQIDLWEQKYLLTAPIDGRVSKSRFFSETQNVREGEIVMTVIPDNPGEIIGKIDLPIEGSGKVDIGQTVNIQFADFPHLQYGMVSGTIRSISEVPTDQLYHLEVDLSGGLTTYYDIEIPFRNEMFGRAEIITDKRVLIERIFDPIRSVIQEQRVTKNAADTETEPK